MISTFFGFPLTIAALMEYLVCRFTRRRVWRYLPPLLALAAAVGLTLYRYYGWSETGERAPLETLLFFPGLPALGVFFGLFLGWRIYRRLWRPRVVKDRGTK